MPSSAASAAVQAFNSGCTDVWPLAFKALDEVFADIVVYETDNGNLLILAADVDVIGDHTDEVFSMPGASKVPT